MPPHEIGIVPNTYRLFSMFFQQTQCTKALGQNSQVAFCKFFHVYFANLDHSNKVQVWPMVPSKWPLIFAQLKFAFYPFSTMKEFLFYFSQKNSTNHQPLNQVERQPLALTPPIVNNSCNYNPLQTQSLGQNFLEFFCMAIMYCSNLSNWKLTYNIVKVVISFCKQMFIIALIYIVHVMVAFGLGQFSLEIFCFFSNGPLKVNLVPN